MLVPVVLRLARKYNIVDQPDATRKLNFRRVPLLGGLAVFAAIVVSVSIFVWLGSSTAHVLPLKFWLGLLSGGLVLMLGGYLDDRYTLRAWQAIVAPSIASLIVIFCGIGVGLSGLASPFGGQIPLDFPVLGLQASYIFVFLWMMGMIYTTKFLDGVDGLASGIGVIASVAMFFVSLTPKVNQPVSAVIAVIIAGSLLGFWFYNKAPAKIYLGESGSLFIGYCLGALAVLLGAKTATAMLVMGLPILDVAWVIISRLRAGQSPFRADRRHLHFRLQDVGLSAKQTTWVYFAFAVVFGGVALFLQSRGKGIALGILLLCFIGIFIAIRYFARVEK